MARANTWTGTYFAFLNGWLFQQKKSIHGNYRIQSLQLLSSIHVPCKNLLFIYKTSTFGTIYIEQDIPKCL
jgi:hypothetical protein